MMRPIIGVRVRATGIQPNTARHYRLAVQAFYHSDAGAARPFGLFSVTVLPPLSTPQHSDYDEGLVAAQRRDRSDPAGETLILVTVNWTPLDETGFIPSVYGIALVWICLGGVLITWSKRMLRQS